VGHGADLYNFENCSIDKLRWEVNKDEDYFRACSRCEIEVQLDDERAKLMVVEQLRWDKRSGGGRGRTLKTSIPELGLIAGDRLEPSESLQDIGLLEEIETPSRVTFWRTSAESIARHRNPLFTEELGISPHRCMTIDTLHCLYLGIMIVWCRIVVWVVFLSGVFGSVGSAEEKLQTAVLVMRSELLNWYSAHEKSNGEVLTRVSDINLKMFGKQSDPKCKTKGAETWGLLLFLLHILRKHADFLGNRGRRLLLAGQALENIVRIWQRHGRIVPPDARTSCFELYMEHVRLMAPEDSFIPKHHLFVHLLSKIGELGNPRMFATWEDEACNRQLKACARNVSQATFESTMITRMQEVLRGERRECKRKHQAL